MTANGQPAEIQPLLLRTRDAAALLAVSQRTLWTMTRDGEIPVVRVRRTVRYLVSDLTAWVMKHRGFARPGKAATSGSEAPAPPGL
jgi:excisionase family DNA binding protein